MALRTNNQISLNVLIKINDEIVMNPRSGSVYFEIYAGTSGVVFIQNIADGGQPLAISNSLDQSIDFLEIVIYRILTIVIA